MINKALNATTDISRAIIEAQANGVSVNELIRSIRLITEVSTSSCDGVQIRRNNKGVGLWIKGYTYKRDSTGER